MGKRRGIYSVIVVKPEGKKPYGRLRCRWEDNIKMDLQEVRCGGMDWIDLFQYMDSWQGTCECSIGPSGYIKYGEFFAQLRNG
jgi:hypothetical protein